jgi:hypothetical protein
MKRLYSVQVKYKELMSRNYHFHGNNIKRVFITRRRNIHTVGRSVVIITHTVLFSLKIT